VAHLHTGGELTILPNRAKPITFWRRRADAGRGP
jgi:hypothetical protein